MFQLFKKSKTIEPVNSYPAIVKEIHNEFYTASDRILSEANEILQGAKQSNFSKGKRLAKIGFKQVPEAVTALQTEAKVTTTKQQADIVRFYQNKYPQYKFITREQVEIICEKYGLICASIDRFKGFVPERCLVDIERFSVDKKDKSTSVWSVGIVSRHIGEELNDDGKSAESWSNLYKKENRDMPLQICAPIVDMDVTGLERRGYFYETKKDVPDPVVLQSVKHGYLIVTAWGDEASDRLVVNEKMN